MNAKHLNKRPELEHSEIIEAVPVACSNETAAVEFLEKQRWGDTPCCPHCGSVAVYKMVDAKTGERNKRYLWRCKDCRKQYTVRIGTVYEDSRIPLRHWCYAFWAACASKKGVSALQIKRQTGLSYKSALFMMHRIRFAMAPDQAPAPKLQGLVECDETYVGGKPRPGSGPQSYEHRATKTPVFGMVQRNGQIRRRVVAEVTAPKLKAAMQECIDHNSIIFTDESKVYPRFARTFKGGHFSVCHSKKEYARGIINTNTIESSFAILKRALIGTFHAVSKEHLHRYVAEFDFKWNSRKNNDGERLAALIRSADGKRLEYSALVGRN
jgi:transposase-like protein